MPSTYVKTQHDFGIVDPSTSSTVGLTCTRDKDNKIQYAEYDDQYLAQQFFNNAASYEYTPPERRILIGQTDWRSGMGLEFADRDDPYRYYQSFGCDLRWKGMICAGYKGTAITPATMTTLVIINGDMELETGWTGGARSNAQHYQGAFSWKINLGGNTAVQTLATWSNNFRLTTIKITAWGYSDGAAATTPFTLFDGVDTTTCTGSAPNGSWGGLSITHRFNAAATGCTLTFTSNVGQALYIDEVTISYQATDGATPRRGVAEFADNIYIARGNMLQEMNAGGTAFTNVYSFPDTISSLEVFKDSLYVSIYNPVDLDSCDTAWTAGADVTASADSTDYVEGSASAKFVVADAAGVQIIGYHTITSVDITKYTGVRLWVKSSIDLNAGDYEICVDDTAACASYLENVDIPAISANTWTQVELKWASNNDLSDIISVGLRCAVDRGAHSIWLDHIELMNSYWYVTSINTGTESTATNSYYQYFRTVRTTADTLYGNDTNKTIRSTVNPLNSGTAWSAQTAVGDYINDIQDLLSYSGALYIPKEDMLYYLNSTGVVKDDAAPELKSLTSTYSGKNCLIYQGKMYYPAGQNSLLEIGDSNTWISPCLSITNDSSFTGNVQALGTDDMWLFAVTDNSTKVEVQAGRWETINDSTDWVWHPICEITLAGAQTALVSSIYQRRLWIFSTSSSDSIYYVPLPSGYGNVAADSNRSFATDSSCYFVTPWYHADFRKDNKAYMTLTCSMGHTYSATVYWTVSYEIMGDTDWTSIGNFDGSATSMVESKTIPADAASNNPTSPFIRLKFVSVTNSATVTPALYDYWITSILYPPDESKSIIACTVKDTVNFLTRKAGEPEKGTKYLIEDCIEHALASSYPVTIYDIEGTSRTVKFLPLPSGTQRRKIVRRDAATGVLEYEWNLLMKVIS